LVLVNTSLCKNQKIIADFTTIALLNFTVTRLKQSADHAISFFVFNQGSFYSTTFSGKLRFTIPSQKPHSAHAINSNLVFS